ncbi:MAG: insulinase family protein, partial [Bacteroidetes bacterium]
MKNFTKLSILAISLFAFININAQSGISTNVPMDPSVRTGKLANGLTYYIMQNKIPKNRAEFYLAINAGAILETPGQNGLAHFTEHMCFNGTKNFPDKAVINYMESIGNKFGNDVNAYTVTDRTVYTLTKVPVDKVGAIDTTLMVLYDWGCNVTEDGKEIDAERGVIREEFRTRMSGMARAQMETQRVLYQGSKYEI